MVDKTPHRKLKFWVTWTLFKDSHELRCSRRIRWPYSFSCTHHVVTLDKYPIINHKRQKQGMTVTTTNNISQVICDTYSISAKLPVESLDLSIIKNNLDQGCSDRERFLLNGPMVPSSKFQWAIQKINGPYEPNGPFFTCIFRWKKCVFKF
jgi:hypothetical protein